jgi:uncharacterized protein (DUF1778 family)
MLPQESTPDTRSARTDRINLRANAQQATLIRRAADARGKSVTEFVLDSATVRAEQVLADRRWFELDDAAWHAFEAALDRPVVFKPRLSESLNEADPFVD